MSKSEYDIEEQLAVMVSDLATDSGPMVYITYSVPREVLDWEVIQNGGCHQHAIEAIRLRHLLEYAREMMLPF